MTRPPDPRTLDADAAWELVRAVPRGGLDGPIRVQHPDDAGASLEIDAAGAWRTSRACTDAARDLLDLYLPLQLRGDLVVGQLGQSLDGRIATRTGHSFWVTGPEDIVRLHRVRALVDAVVIGASTAISDDPQLTVRKVSGDDPVRVVLDPAARVPASCRALSSQRGRALVLRGPGQGEAPSPCEVLTLPTDAEGRFAPAEILGALRARGLRRVLIEGGGLTISGFLTAGLLDRLHLTVAPLLLGSGRPSLTLPAIDRVDEAMRPCYRRFLLGEDVLFDLDLRGSPGSNSSAPGQVESSTSAP